jgi:hypothetical protein
VSIGNSPLDSRNHRTTSICREGGLALSATILLTIDLITAVKEEASNGVSQLVRFPFVVIRGTVLLVVKTVQNVDRVTTVVRKVANHCLTCEVVCRTFVDSLDLSMILKGVPSIGDGHANFLSRSIHAESTRRSIHGVSVSNNGNEHVEIIVHSKNCLLRWMNIGKSSGLMKDSGQTGTPVTEKTTSLGSKSSGPFLKVT